MLKIRERRPDAVFEAFSNSAPYWMTLSGCCAGNVNATDDNLDPRYYDTFAHYLVDVCTFYRDSFNLVFHTLEPFNEPVTNYWKANDSQEGCHFSLTEQLKFVKVLAPVLKASGLPTLISASDETSVSQSVIDLKGYIADRKALSLIGQWNTHTYAADNASRQELRTLATSADRPLWMSEVGGGSGGIKGNLELAHKLIQDIRFLQPDVWCDWQYMEEYGDQWSLINGRFNKQVYRKTKNYYVHYQFTHYISSGYRFIDLGNAQSLAALSPASDTLVVVAMNLSERSVRHQIQLRNMHLIPNAFTATRTSPTENNASVTDCAYANDTLTVDLPPLSIATVVCPLNKE
jgi:O-glycosyl hydrolase